MSQSRFSIVLVGVSALLRRPLVSRLRPADGERSSWVVFAARRRLPFRRCPRRVGLRAHGFRFSACAASGLPSASWPSGSRLPLFGTHRFGVAARRVGLRAYRFRFSACTASEWLLGEFVLPPSVSELPFGGLGFGLTASAFRHAPLRGCPRRVDLRAHDFRFSVRTASGLPSAGWFFHSSGWFFRLPLRKLPSAGWPSGSLLPFFGTRRFGVAAGRVGSSAFRFGDGRRASWPSGSLLPLFGTHRSAPPYRRSEDRRSTTTRQLFHFKTLIPTC